MANARRLAVSALLKVDNKDAYSNITLNNIFKETDATPADKALTTAIFYGVLDRRITLDYVLQGFLKTPLKKVAPFTKEVLRSALYQIMYMDRIPDSAAVNEAVKMIKKSKESRNSGFVNGVLRNVLRTENLIPQDDSDKSLSIRYSCPEWIIKSFNQDYGKDNTIKLLEESLKPAPIVIRVNTTKIDCESLKAKLDEKNISCSECAIDNALILEKGFDIQKNSYYKKGLFHVQDTASQTAVGVLSPKPNERVLDLCAAPGGKSFTMAELMSNQGELISCDLYENRVGLIEEGSKRLGLDMIRPIVNDATVYNENIGKFDCVLCDVPCSGLGILRRKPDIKYNPETDYNKLSEIQYEIVNNALSYLKEGGRLLYSTCTLRKAENEDMVTRILNENKGLHKMYEHTYMPHIDNTDGFFCALIVKE